MKKIILFRHAKSSWELGVSDKQRTILEEGKLRTTKVALASKKHINADFYFVSSTATRALETAQIALNVWDIPVESLIIKDEYYTFNLHQLVENIKALPQNASTVVIFGHNEAFTDFVNKYGSEFIDNVPTSGFVQIDFKTQEWNSLQKGVTTKIIFSKEIS